MGFMAQLTPNALRVLEKRYLWRDSGGQVVETAEELFARVARAVSQAERKWCKDDVALVKIEEDFFKAMVTGRFLPNSPTLMNAGKADGQLSACFVLPVPDTLEGIFETCKNAALIHKTGGGTGFSFSRLRPANDRVNTTTGVASGPVSFMTVYDAATEAIRQGGTRRGANMGILRVDHPDIEEFIAAKKDTGKLNNFNISVAVSDSFMKAVEEDGDYDLIHPGTGQVAGSRKARDIFERIVENAHATGEPGIIFLDRINAYDPITEARDENGTPVAGTQPIEATNPCGEQPLGPGDACNLGSINLAEFTGVDGEFDWDSLAEMAAIAVRFLDDIVEVNAYPLPFISETALANRRIGLGVMGWAEALIKLEVAYDSDKAVELAENVMSFINEKAHEASRKLAEVRGNFPNWKHSAWAERNISMRNLTVTTIAPTGTISIIAGTTSGIEPLFAVSYVRRVLGGEELIEVNPLFEKIAKERGFYSQSLMKQMAREGSLAGIEEIPEDIKRLFVTAHEIDYKWHVAMQAAFQKHTDCAVSKTINFPAEATVDDVREAYLAAYRGNLKGITVYRDTSRDSQVLNIGKTDPVKKRDSAGPEGTADSPRMAVVRSAAKPVLSVRKFNSALNPVWGSMDMQPAAVISGACPGCGASASSMLKSEACMSCVSCGYTKC